MIPGSAAASGLLGSLCWSGWPAAFRHLGLALVPRARAVLALGVAALAEYAFGIDLGIDRWPLPTSLDARRGTAPARMSLLEGICLYFLPSAMS